MNKFAREATIKLVFRILLSVIIFDFFYLFLTLFEEFVLDLNEAGPMLLSYSALYHLVLIVLQLVTIIYLFVKWYISYYVVSDTHLTKKTGLLVKRDKVVNYGNVRVVNYKQGVLGRIFNYGDIVFEMVGGGDDLIVKGIESPSSIVEIIQKSIKKN